MSNVKDILIDVIGPYEPVVTTSSSVTYDSDVPVDGIGSLDVVWIFACILFICAFKGVLDIFRALIGSLSR